MKKFISLFAAVLFAGSMMADSYVKVTEAPTDWAGQYLLVYEGDASHAAVAFNSGLETLDASSNGLAVEINEGVIAGSEELSAAEITIAAVEGGYSIEAANGKFIGATKYENKLVAADEAIATALSIDDSGNAVLSVSVDNKGAAAEVTMRYNYAVDQLRFRYYKSGQQAVALYKFEAGGVTPTAVAKPVIAGEESFEESVEVTITAAEGASIYYTIDGAEPTAASALYEAPFTLTATATVKAIAKVGDDVSAVASKTFTKVEPLAEPTNCAEAAAAALSVSANNELYNNGAEYTIQGYVTEIAYAYDATKGNMSFWMADAANGGKVLEAYKCAIENEEGAVRVGDKVAVTGQLTKYNTTPEFAQGCTVVIIERAEVVDPVNLGEKTIAEFLALANTKDTCILTGIVANIKTNSDGSYNKYGNFDLVEVDNAEVSVYIYGLLTADGQAQQFQTMGVDEGDTLTVKAIYSVYNNAPQVKNAIYVSHTDATPTAIDNTNIDAKAIKFFENGMLIIEKNGVRYNAQGAVVR